MPIDHILRAELNADQRAVATDRAARVLCLACAGSGKTRTLAYRTARLLAEDVDPKSIVAFTFTEKAAESLKSRIADALEKAGLPGTLVGAMFVGTIHSFCQNVLGEMDARYRQFDVLDENRLKLYLISRYPATARRSRHRTRKQGAVFRDNPASLGCLETHERRTP
jgi:DNA helicase-2/ATP-dependent DNA helicase PcrA